MIWNVLFAKGLLVDNNHSFSILKGHLYENDINYILWWHGIHVVLSMMLRVIIHQFELNEQIIHQPKYTTMSPFLIKWTNAATKQDNSVETSRSNREKPNSNLHSACLFSFKIWERCPRLLYWFDLFLWKWNI